MDAAAGIILKDMDAATILDRAYICAENHVVAAGRPSMSIQIEKVDERCLAGLYYVLMLSTVMSAELYGIDPFDQPGVDHGKHGLFAQYGRSGFEDLASKLSAHRTKPRRVC